MKLFKCSWKCMFVRLPLLCFLLLAALFFYQLYHGNDQGTIPSALIGKPAPIFALAPLEGIEIDGNSVPAFTSDIFSGQVTLVNVWASWCPPCRQEHSILMELAKDSWIQMASINYKDSSANALQFLSELGNPYAFIGVDPKGETAINWGVYGIPETFIVDRNGVIVHKHIGALDPARLQNAFLPALKRALQS